ncbi:MAG TPA: type IX secretion system membrane protein PorP/SprF [Membranihabitans sp.]|nr:type IX secretion system membrane protein PorP/SprF [Membranihabitans sp.]
MYSRKFIFWWILMFPVVLWGQNLPQMSSAHWDPYLYNPAFGGITGITQLTAHFRSQWQGIDGQPQTQMLSAYTPVDMINSSVGVQFWADRIGRVKSQNLLATYSYVLDIPFGALSFGVAAGMDRKSFLGTDWRAPDGEYGIGVISHNDPLLSEEKISGFAPRVDIGLYFSSPFFEVGVSSQNITPFGYIISGSQASPEGKQLRSYVFQGLYFYDLSETILLVPSLLVKTNGKYTQTEIGAGVDYLGTLKGGMYLRGYNSSSIDALVIQAGYQFAENAYVYYSFDLGLSGLRRVHDNSHEISLRYVIDEPLFKVQREKIIYNPRFIE